MDTTVVFASRAPESKQASIYTTVLWQQCRRGSGSAFRSACAYIYIYIYTYSLRHYVKVVERLIPAVRRHRPVRAKRKADWGPVGRNESVTVADGALAARSVAVADGALEARPLC
jgi:hypothetical protein